MPRPSTWRMLAIGLSIATFTTIGLLAGLALDDDQPETIDGLTRTGPCPEPGLLDVGRRAERIQTCEAARVVERLLLASGASAAEAHVRFEDGSNPLGADRELHVVARITLMADEREDWDGRSIARLIARSVGTPVEHVAIHDARGRTLFDGLERREESQPTRRRTG